MEPSTEFTVHGRPERHEWAEVRQAQHRLTDGVTAFAGSPVLGYLEVAWLRRPGRRPAGPSYAAAA